MEVGMENQRINVLINLSSRLLCEAMQRLLENEATNSTMLMHDPDQVDGSAPYEILVDAATLEQSFPAHWDNAKVILIDTGLSEDEIIRLLMTHKLHGVISTGTGTELFLKALGAIRAGQVWIDNGKIRSILHNHPPAGNGMVQKSYSRREREIVLLIAEGCTNRQIAVHLNISEQTVKTHICRIFRKADVSSRAQLVPQALKFKLDADHSSSHGFTSS